MSTFRSLFHSLAPVLGLFVLLAVPAPFLNSAEAEPAAKSESAIETCPVCSKNMKDVTDKKTMTIEGRNLHCCSDKCGAEVKAHQEYYKGFHDGAARVHKSHIGPKGGDTRKGPHSEK